MADRIEGLSAGGDDYVTKPFAMGELLLRLHRLVERSGVVSQDTEEVVEESLSLAGKEVEMIRKALEKYNGKRKLAASELGISERTLYRKIKEYGIEM